jgi:GNAT superfamily N-acetyltransferase
MRIERARPSAARFLTGLAQEAKRTWGYPEAWIRSWKPALTVTPEDLRRIPTYCARVGRTIAGFCTVAIRGDRAFAEHFWVAPTHQGRGVGRALFRRFEAEARRAGAKRLLVDSDPHAVGFYLKMGARLVGLRPAPMGGVDRSLPCLEKRLGRRTGLQADRTAPPGPVAPRPRKPVRPGRRRASPLRAPG